MWTQADDDLITLWATECQATKLLLDRAKIIYTLRANIFKYPEIILGTCVTSGLFMSFVTELTLQVMGVCWILFTAINYATNYTHMAHQCLQASLRCQVITMKCQNELSKLIVNRDNPDIFKATITSLMQGINSPDLPFHLERNFIHDIDTRFSTLHIPNSRALDNNITSKITSFRAFT